MIWWLWTYQNLVSDPPNKQELVAKTTNNHLMLQALVVQSKLVIGYWRAPDDSIYYYHGLSGIISGYFEQI